MSKQISKVSNERIQEFLEGSNPEKYIVGIEANYDNPNVSLIINDPDDGKSIRQDKFKSFLWFKESIGKKLYGGSRTKRIEAGGRYGVKIKTLRTSDINGETPERLANGYRFMATCEKSYNSLVNFFKEGGIDVFSEEYRSGIVMFSPVEQYMIQTGRRLFKGIDDYDGLHRFQFDLETEGLFASKNAIFQIGVRDNRGLDGILETTGETLQERRKSERENIKKFFKIIDIVKPDVITGYNSENFDWPYLFERADRLSMSITELAITLNVLNKIKRKKATVKFGGETEHYQQTHMWGYSILDISHAVRRAMAINSEIKGWGLKYITQYSEIAKPNRVYVAGDKINSTWADTINQYAFNNENGDWYIIDDRKQLKEGYKIVTGAYIVQRYLSDDLWETEQIDNIFNQASFLIAKMLPTTFERSSTMGTAGQWKLIMSAWSYENGLAIPETQPKRDFTGGLSRLLEVGYAKNVVKLDFAALYPKIQLTHGIFPDLDITGVMEGTLTYVVDTRDHFKFLTGEEKSKYKALEKELKTKKDSLSNEEIIEIKKKIDEHKALANIYDKKQLPLKILANSWFGSYGAPYIFNWGDTDSAEETTCRGRQYLRLMVRHFTKKHGFRALVGDSVTHDTPIYIRYKTPNKEIDIIPISQLFNEHSKFLDEDKLRDFEEKPFEVLTRNGWKEIKYVYRHSTDKSIHRITTKDRLLNVTEDHSLFQNGIEVKPSELKRGDLLDVYEIPFNNVDYIFKPNEISFYGRLLRYGHLNKDNKLFLYGIEITDKNLVKKYIKFCFDKDGSKKIPNKILNASVEVKKIFIDSFVEKSKEVSFDSQTFMCGFILLLKEINVGFTLKNDELNTIVFGFTNESETNKVWKNEIIQNNDPNGYVYDISTEDGTFICGINGIIAHNTDGFNFAFPDNIDEIKYTPKGSHWKTDKDGGKELTGLDAVLAEFNENYMEGRMGLDIDDICNSTINFSRKNYANDIGGKIKLVGNSVKSKKMSVYIEEFLGKGIRMLLDGDGYSFINYYYEYVDKIYNYQIPLVKIASKAKVKTSIADYKKKATMKNKAGNPLPKQAHMELVIREGLDVSLGDTIYYINTGLSKSDGDLKTVDKNKMTKKERGLFFKEHGYYPTPNKVVELNCKMINPETVEKDFEMVKELEMLKKALIVLKNEEDFNEEVYNETEKRIQEINDSLYTDEYNVGKYLEAFNKKVKPLLVCFSPEVRNKVLLTITKIKNKETKKTLEVLKERTIFTQSECELVSGIPNKEIDQDSYDELMKMEDKEIKFWVSVNKIPNNLEDESKWDEIVADYKERLEKAKQDGIQQQKETLEDIFKRLEIDEIQNIYNTGELPIDVFVIADLGDDDINLVSRKWDEPLCTIRDIFKYESEAKKRDEFYKMNNLENSENKYEEYLNYCYENTVFTGNTLEITQTDLPLEKLGEIASLVKDKSKNILKDKSKTEKKVQQKSGDEDDEDEEELEEDENGDIVRKTDIIQLDDEFDDTYAQNHEEEVEKHKQHYYQKPIFETKKENIEIKKEEPKDEWGF